MDLYRVHGLFAMVPLFSPIERVVHHLLVHTTGIDQWFWVFQNIETSDGYEWLYFCLFLFDSCRTLTHCVVQVLVDGLTHVAKSRGRRHAVHDWCPPPLSYRDAMFLV